MHLLKSKKIKLLLCSLITTNLFSQELFNEEILSENRKKTFQLQEEQAKENSSKLKKDWINPITLQYVKNLGDEYKNEKSLITINQPIFKSGGIYEAIKYANSTHKYVNLEIEQQRNMLIKEALNLLFQIKKSELNLAKAKFSLENAKIDVNRKREQVFNGFLDSSFLDNALLALNDAKHKIVDLKYQKRELIDNFHNISSKHYTSFTLPNFEIISQKDYLDKNIELQKADASIQRESNFSFMTMAKYLPSVNAFYNYTKHHYSNEAPTGQNNEQNFGLSITMPLDTRTFNDIQSQKIEYLKAKLSLNNKIDDEKTFFKIKLAKIDMLNERIQITNEDLKVYKSILDVIEEEKEAQLKTQSDYDTLKNSQQIKALDLKIFSLDKQIQLLDLYTKLQ